MVAEIEFQVLKVISKSFTDKDGKVVPYAYVFGYDKEADDVQRFKLRSDLVTTLSGYEGEVVRCRFNTSYNKIFDIL